MPSAALRASRRAFLRFVLGSPLFLGPLGCSRSSEAPPRAAPVGAGAPEPAAGGIRRASHAVNVFDFEAVARRNLLPAHYAYLSMGVEHEVTLAANRAAFAKIQLRPRRLVDVREVDTATELLGTTLSSPILLAPVGSQAMYHAEAEGAVARAARRRDHLMILSMGSSTSLAEVVRARGEPVWAQLYGQRSWIATRWLLRRAEAAGCSAIVLTVDIVGLPTNRERIERFRRAENPACQACHGSVVGALARGAVRAADAVGIDVMKTIADSMILDWEIVDRIRDATSLPLVVKGILTQEDAHLCVEHGVDGIVVSNHGGRAEDSGRASIEVLPEIVAAVDGRIPVLVDSGFRRGSDVVKALALGARAVCVGRPYLWGLAAFGQEGVEAVLAILRRELETMMRQLGTPSLEAITRARVSLGPAAAPR